MHPSDKSGPPDENQGLQGQNPPLSGQIPSNPAQNQGKAPWQPSINKDGHIHASNGPQEWVDTSGAVIRPFIPLPSDDASAPAGAVKLSDVCPPERYDPNDPNSRWHARKTKFTLDRQRVFLTQLERTGRVMLAARWAGVVNSTVLKYRKENPDFDEMCRDALEMYHEQTVALITMQAREGILETRTNARGDVVGERRVFETPIRLAMLRRADSSYIEKKEETVTVQGGAVVVPAPADGVQDWASVVAAHEAGGKATRIDSKEPGANGAPVLATTGVDVDTVASRLPEPLSEVSWVDGTSGSERQPLPVVSPTDNDQGTAGPLVIKRRPAKPDPLA